MVSTTAPPVAATLNTLAVLSDFNLDRKIGEQNQTINNALADRRRALDQVKKCEKSAVETAWSLGKLLNEKKGRLGHGAWLPWLATTGIPTTSANEYMLLGRQITGAGYLGPSIRATLKELSPPTPAAVQPEPGEVDSTAVIAALEDDLGTAQERIAIMAESTDPKSRKAIDRLNNQTELIKTLKASVANWQSKASAARKENASLKRKIKALETELGRRRPRHVA